MPRMVPKRDKNPAKTRIPFNVPILNSLLKYIRCEYVGGTRLEMLHRLLDTIDLNAYVQQTDVYQRLMTLKILTRMMVKESIREENLLLSGLTDEFPEGVRIIQDVGFKENQLNSTECDKIAQLIEARTQALVIFRMKDRLIETLMSFESSSFETSYFELVKSVRDQMNDILTEMQKDEDEGTLLREFSFSDANAAHLIDLMIKKRKAPSYILQTGIRQLNAILNPGFYAGGLYTILGGSGKFKSGTLLNLADQMRRYNPQIVPYENGMRKTILYISLENSIEMTFERIFDMYSDLNDDLRDMETARVLEILRTKGEFTFTDTHGIDLTMVYRGNLEIDTNNVRTMIQYFRERGKMPICIIVDYLKRIRSTNPSNGDERLRMSYAAKELRNIGQDFQIPIITAMQLNREGNSIIDAAMRENKSDVARFVGSSSIGSAWDVIEDSDWVCLINPEKQRSTGQAFLTFKRLKNRNKNSIDNTVDYFNHPFTNEKNIRLVPDVDLPQGVSIVSLASDLEGIEEEDREKKSNLRRGDQIKPASASAAYLENKTAKVVSSLKPVVVDNMLA